MSTSADAGTLDGRVALVTGGSRGIGRGIALGLGAAGARVVVNYRRDAKAAEAVVRRIRETGGDAIAIAASVDDTDALDRLVGGAREAFGDVDLFVHNAGIASRGNLVAETDTAELQRVLATHAVAAHHLARLLLPGMRQCRRSDVVVISSSEVERMRAGGAPYNMAKSALEAFALTLAKEECTHGVRVNIVAPGLVATDMGDRLVRATQAAESVTDLDATQPFGRVCRPEDIARVVLFLVGDNAAMVTGQRITVDGGGEPPLTGAPAAAGLSAARA